MQSGPKIAPAELGVEPLLTNKPRYTKIRIMTLPDWAIEYYVEDSGHVPVREFLKGLDQRTYARFLWSLGMVQK